MPATADIGDAGARRYHSGMIPDRSRSVAHPALALMLVLAGGRAGAQTAPAVEAESALADAAWIVDEIGLGVSWRAARFADMFGAPQSLNVLEIELPRGARRLRFSAPEPFARVPTSEIAGAQGALAAVNGGFFDVDNGAPFGLLKEDGVLRVEQDEKRTVAIGVDRRECVSIEQRGPGDWRGVEHARGSWPLILRNGKPVRPEGWGARDRRHPRTAAGLTRRGDLILLTADGRTPEAAGMTLLELASTMQALGCETAMNLDGGGSTTMWIRSRGVVNFPSDNSRYDHAGERAVADAVLVFAAAVLRLDEDLAVLSPKSAWQRAEDERCIGGDCARAAGPDAEARFEVTVAAGDYAVELRWPRLQGGARSLECVVGTRAPLRAEPHRAAYRWNRVGTVSLSAEPVTIVIRTDAAEPFAIDALRLVEIAGDRR